jgi:hypothetical protein
MLQVLRVASRRDVLPSLESNLGKALRQGPIPIGSSTQFIEGFPSRNRGGIPEGWMVLIRISPFGRILGSSILVVPLVTSTIIGLAGEIRKKRD